MHQVSPWGDEAVSRDFRHVTAEIHRRMGAGGIGYFAGLAATVLMMGVGAAAWGFQLSLGMGLAGYTHPIMWATYIANFVWWIGIAHSGTMISAILYLFRARFRTSFARSGEAMTLVAITTAAAFPVIHLGRAWRAYWLFPYPNERGIWPTFRSPLVMDVFAILTYFVVSLLFFWLGLAPDLAILRDRSKGWRRTIYGLLSLGWQGQGRQWKPYLLAYGILAGLATPLVISVHSVVSWDFSLALVPGWHSTIFPPYFVIGAIFSGLAMILTLILPMRRWMRLEEFIKEEHLDRIARLVLAMSLLVSFSYLLEYGMELRSSEAIDRINLLYKAAGPFAPLFWISVACNSVAPLVLFSAHARRSPLLLFALSILINVGMWLERFVIIAGSLGRGYLPYAWEPDGYRIALVEWGICIGSAGWFLFWFLLFVRYLPVLPIAEIKRERLKEFRERAVREYGGAGVREYGSAGVRE